MEQKKSEKANLRGKNILFFLIGINIVLASLLFAFQMKSYKSFSNVEKFVEVEQQTDIVIEEIAEPEEIEEPEPIEEPPPAPPVVELEIPVDVKEVEKKEIKEEKVKEKDVDLDQKFDENSDREYKANTNYSDAASSNFSSNKVYSYGEVAHHALVNPQCKPSSKGREKVCFKRGLKSLIEEYYGDYYDEVQEILEDEGFNDPTQNAVTRAKRTVSIVFIIETDGTFTIERVEGGALKDFKDISKNIIQDISKEQARRKKNGPITPAQFVDNLGNSNNARTRFIHSFEFTYEPN